MKNISRFDLGVIIAFVVITLAGFGGWYYFSGTLSDATANVTTAKADFDKFSVAKGAKTSIEVSQGNKKKLQDDIDLIQAELMPIIQSKLLSKDNKLSSLAQEDPVAWKHDLDDEVHRLTALAKARSVALPPNFYFSFSRYLNSNPTDVQTTALSKQLIGVEQITTILINAPVKSIQNIGRTYEEDPRTTAPPGGQIEADHMPGSAAHAPGNIYTSYPFAFEFDTTAETLRKIVDDLIQSPYVLILRSISVENSQAQSPLINGLAALAGTPAGSVVSSDPGEVAATTSNNKGLQYLFGNSTIHVKAQIDMIEWDVPDLGAPSGLAHGGAPGKTSQPGGN